MLGWDALEPALLAELPERITPYYSGAVNLNTAPAVLLPHWVPGCPETCDRLVAMRREQPFRLATISRPGWASHCPAMPVSTTVSWPMNPSALPGGAGQARFGGCMYD